MKRGKFELLDVSLIKSLEREFTTCIIELPWFEISGREQDIFEKVAKEAYPLLCDNAQVLVRAEIDSYSIAERAFNRSGFKLANVLAQITGDHYNQWLLFQRGDRDELPDISKTVFPSRKTPKRQENFYRQMEPDAPTVPQSFYREVLQLLCPKPRKAKVLVPYFRFGSAIAACQALGIKSVGYDATEIYAADTWLEHIRDTIVYISQFK